MYEAICDESGSVSDGFGRLPDPKCLLQQLQCWAHREASWRSAEGCKSQSVRWMVFGKWWTIRATCICQVRLIDAVWDRHPLAKLTVPSILQRSWTRINSMCCHIRCLLPPPRRLCFCMFLPSSVCLSVSPQNNYRQITTRLVK